MQLLALSYENSSVIVILPCHDPSVIAEPLGIYDICSHV